jgi:hypothetical protein
MSREPLTYRANIKRRIFKLRQDINLQLAFGDANEANRLRDRISELERDLQLIDQRKREAREGEKTP